MLPGNLPRFPLRRPSVSVIPTSYGGLESILPIQQLPITPEQWDVVLDRHRDLHYFNQMRFLGSQVLGSVTSQSARLSAPGRLVSEYAVRYSFILS